MLMPASDRALNVRAATPGCDFIPAPTRDTLPISVSTSTERAPIWSATCLEIRSASEMLALGTVKLMSVIPSCETF